MLLRGCSGLVTITQLRLCPECPTFFANKLMISYRTSLIVAGVNRLPVFGQI